VRFTIKPHRHRACEVVKEARALFEQEVADMIVAMVWP
jgi:hypothetical protein